MSDGIVHIGAGDAVEYGDTAVSPAWMSRLLSTCDLVGRRSDWNHGDPYQVIWLRRGPAEKLSG